MIGMTQKKHLIETLITTHYGGMFINIVQATTTCLKKYFIFSGRAKRSEFWWFYLFTVIVSVVYTSVVDNLLYEVLLDTQGAVGQIGILIFVVLFLHLEHTPE